MLDIYTIDPHNSLSLSRTECIDQLQVSKPIGRILEQQGDRSLAHNPVATQHKRRTEDNPDSQGQEKKAQKVLYLHVTVYHTKLY